MSGEVPPPVPPGDPAAWYAPDVRAQYTVAPDVVVTIRETAAAFRYEPREPTRSPADRAALDRVLGYFADATVQRPLTREGVVERLQAGFTPKGEQAFDRLTDVSHAGRRRVEYLAVAAVRGVGAATPLALDDRIEMADVEEDRVVVHTEDFAPAVTDLREPTGFDRFAAERLARYTVAFEGFEIPVVLYRENTLGGDHFAVKYAVLEPDLLPGDRELIAACKDRVWEAGVDEVVADRVAFVRERAETLLARRLTARNATAWVETTRHRVRSALAEYDLALPPASDRFARDRLDDLVYYVLRDFVGHGELTVPVRDPNLEDVEANRVGERIKVVPRSDLYDGRVPTNLVFDSEQEFVNVVTQLAAADGTELNASQPSAKVNLDTGRDETVRCAVALPTVSEDGPHVSIRKQSTDPLTAIDLVERDALPTELVALLWLLYEHRGVVLFSGATGVGKTTLMNAHMPFIPYEARPISIDEGSREVVLPHETGVSLTTREHRREHKRVSMADLMTEANYLNPDTEILAEVNTRASFETFAQTLQTGHGVVGTTHAEDVEKLVNRVVEQGLPAYLLRELDLVVFPRRTDGHRYVGEAVELLTEREFDDLDADPGDSGRIEKDGSVIFWNRLCRRSTEGDGFTFAYDHPSLGGTTRHVGTKVFERFAARTDRPVAAVEREFHRKHRYVEYFRDEGLTDFDELFGFLADLQTDEAATVERARTEVSRGDD